MKKLFTLLTTVTLSVMLFAQAPQSFSYQTVIRDASWTVLDNQSVGIKISILEDVANGNVVYEESHSATTSQIGLVNLSIGEGTVMSGSFSTIDWGNHNYFIEVAVDINGGSNYIVMGSTQLRSVPYALYAENSGSSIPGPQGPIGLTGPAGANGIDGTDGTDCCNAIDSLSQVVSNLDSALTTQTSLFVFGCMDAMADNYNSIANLDDGSCSYLSQYSPGSVFCSSGPTAIVDVTNPVTGKTWMDRNLGATQVAMSPTDTLAYGGLYQWGRESDGHQCRNSPNTTTLSTTDQPTNGNFIIVSNTPDDWRSPQNPNLWQGANGINNPCPSGYRLPTEIEMNEEVLSWSSTDAAGAFASPLKWTVTGYRSHNTANIMAAGGNGSYHTSTVDGTLSSYLSFNSNIGGIYTGARASGSACRCIKEVTGCTDSTALNYNASANTDDGSCTYPFSGAIGDTYQGGIVFWLDGNGGGLIAAPTDQAIGAEWGCYGTAIAGADGTAIGTGAQNTIDIETGCTSSGIAADLCANLTLGGYSDWFLPSKDELSQMYFNLHQQGLGGFANYGYWGSTENDNYYAWNQNFTNGLQFNVNKYNFNNVRAVRAF